MTTIEDPRPELNEARKSMRDHYTEMRLISTLESSLRTYINNRVIASYEIDKNITATMDAIKTMEALLRVETEDLNLRIAVLERRVAETLYEVPEDRLKVLDGWASALDGSEYRNVPPPEFEEELKAQGIAVFYGASDDLLEADGAIYDEWGGNGRVNFEKGVVTSIFTQRMDLPDWLIFASVPYRTFRVMEDGRVQCIGIVVHASDLGQPLEEDEE